MKGIEKFLVILALCCMSITNTSWAIPISLTFDPPPAKGKIELLGVYHESGVVIQGKFQHLGIYPGYASNGTGILDAYSGRSLTIAFEDGSPFDWLGGDIALGILATTPAKINIIGVQASDPLTPLVFNHVLGSTTSGKTRGKRRTTKNKHTKGNTFQHISIAGFTGLSALVIKGDFALDNLLLEPRPVTSAAVPLPGSVVLWSTGLFALFCSRRIAPVSSLSQHPIDQNLLS